MSKSGRPVSNSNLPTAITWCGAVPPSPSWRCRWKRTTVTFEFASEVRGCWWLPPLLNAGRARCVCQDASARCSVSKAQRFLCLCVTWQAGLKEVSGCEKKSGERETPRNFQHYAKIWINVEEVRKRCHYFGAMHKQNAAAAFAAHSVLDVCFQGATSRRYSTESSHLHIKSIKSKLCGWMFFFLSHQAQNK